MRFILMVFLWAIVMPAFSTKYYIDPVNGSDSNSGASSASAWKTLSKVNSRTFLPGDSILLARGGIWRESLTVPSSGTSTSYIGFGSYGSGPNPRILGSNTGTWSNSGGNIWISDQTFTNPYGGGFTSEIFFEETSGIVNRGSHKTATSGLIAEYDWTWATNHIYVYAATDPDTRYKAVEIPQRGTIIEPNNKNYIGFTGINLFYSASEGFGDGAYPNQNNSGLIIENSEIAYHGSMAAEIGYGTTAVYSDMIIRNNKIHDCGRRGISIDPYASGFTIKNILIHGNELYNGSHTTAVDMSIGSGNFTVSLDNITICNNIIYDDPNSPLTSEQIFAQNYGVGGTFTNLKIYNNIFKYPNMSSVHLEKVQSANICDNTFFSHNKVKSGNTFHVFVDAGSTNIAIKNNIFYTDLTTDAGVVGIAIYESASQDHKQIDADYNLYYRTGTNLRIVLANGVNYSASNFSSLQSQIGWETHSPAPQNPMFYSAADLHLQSGSPAISRGLPLPEVVTDFAGTTRDNPPEIGCFEYSGSAPAVPVYISSAIASSTPSLLEMTYNLSLANTVPATSSFSVMVNSSARSVSSVAIADTKVQLTIASPVVYGDVVTIAYTKPATNPLQTATGAQAASITAQNVTNNVQALIPVYVSSAIANATPSLLEMTYNLSLANIVPAASAFSVMVNSTGRSVTTVTVSGTKVQLTLASPAKYGDNINVSYTVPATNPLQTASGAQAVSITSKGVTNNVLPAIPDYVSSCIEDVTSNIVSMTYDLELANIVPATSAFSVKVNTIPRTINSVAVIGCYVQLTLSDAVTSTDNVTVEYTKPATNPLQTNEGGEAVNLSSQPVTNNVLEDPVTKVRKPLNVINISIYPNPATDYFNIVFGDLGEIVPQYIRLVNGSGIIMLQVLVENGVLEMHIPINLNSGIYYVQVISDRGLIVATRKLMVKR